MTKTRRFCWLDCQTVGWMPGWTARGKRAQKSTLPSGSHGLYNKKIGNNWKY